MLSMTCFNYIAIETIRDFALKNDKWVFGLTATPANVYKINQFNSLINEVQFSKYRGPALYFVISFSK